MSAVPKRWPGETIVCLGGGPSLTVADVDAVQGRARVIAVNDAYKLAPWADVLYAADRRWIDWHQGVPTFTGLKYSIQANLSTMRLDWHVLRNTGFDGLELDPGALRTGFNSGYQAVNLAVHLGAARIILLGYDLCPDGMRTHWFGDHPQEIAVPSPYPQMREAFQTIVEPLKAAGVEVINCSRRTALTAFPCSTLEAVFAQSEQVA